MKYQTLTQRFQADTAVHDLVTGVIDTINAAEDGQDVDLAFLRKQQVGEFCQALGFSADRNWAQLKLDEIAPTGEENVQVVPEDEAIAIVSAVLLLLDEKKIEPEADGQKNPQLINDFLPEGEQFAGEDCLGHLWELRYALAVELEHGTTRGTNVTTNHPLLTGLVVLAHLSEDRLYYARLWVMETEGALFNAQLEGKPADQVKDSLRDLTLARKHLQARLSEKLDRA